MYKENYMRKLFILLLALGSISVQAECELFYKFHGNWMPVAIVDNRGVVNIRISSFRNVFVVEVKKIADSVVLKQDEYFSVNGYRGTDAFRELQDVINKLAGISYSNGEIDFQCY